MIGMERTLFWAAVGIISAGAAAGVALPAKWKRFRFLALVPGMLVLSATIAVRWAQTGHAPVFGSFETAVADAWAGMLVAIIASVWKPGIRWIAPLVAAFSVGMMVFATQFNAKHYPLTISENSLWVDVHAACAWAAYGLFAAGAAASIVVLVKGDAGQEEFQAAFRFTELGFLFQTGLIASGSYYASILFGKFWQWDFVEVSALLCWIFYGFVLHLNVLFGWKGRRLAGWIIAAFVTCLASYKLPAFLWGMTYHFFDLNL